MHNGVHGQCTRIYEYQVTKSFHMSGVFVEWCFFEYDSVLHRYYNS